jgi:hypothetical protein
MKAVRMSCCAIAMALLALVPARAEETVSTLTLDGLSFLSFGDERAYSLPSGSTIEFHFSSPAADGSRSFTIPTSGVSIAPIELGSGEGSLQYSLSTVAAGTMRSSGGGGRRIDFTASVNATRTTSEGSGTYSYTLPFTTESTEARDLTGAVEIEIQGLRLVEGVWYLQLVGGVTNKADAVPASGTAVYTVISGTFDQVP